MTVIIAAIIISVIIIIIIIIINVIPPQSEAGGEDGDTDCPRRVFERASFIGTAVFSCRIVCLHYYYYCYFRLFFNVLLVYVSFEELPRVEAGPLSVLLVVLVLVALAVYLISMCY